VVTIGTDQLLRNRHSREIGVFAIPACAGGTGDLTVSARQAAATGPPPSRGRGTPGDTWRYRGGNRDGFDQKAAGHRIDCGGDRGRCRPQRGAASASTAALARHTHHAKSATAVTRVVHRDDSGGNGNWALGKFVRTVTVTRVGKSGAMYVYKAVLKDTGTFVTIPHAFTPNQGSPFTGRTIKGVVKGTMSGKAVFTFLASAPYPATSLAATTTERPTGDGGHRGGWHGCRASPPHHVWLFSPQLSACASRRPGCSR
jgi:hypothetical protein